MSRRECGPSLFFVEGNVQSAETRRGCKTGDNDGRFCVVFSLAFCIFATGTLAWASITGNISGLVTDSGGGVVAGAKAVAIEIGTGVRNQTMCGGPI